MTQGSRSVDDFVKAVYVLEQKADGRVSTNALAESLGITAPSVTDMARRLHEAEYVDYQKYQGVLLREKGRDMALKVLRRHRLIELYLMQELGYELHEVHDEAEKLEHYVSDRFVSAVAHKLGNPDVDPHGDPIPSADGVIVQRELTPLAELPLHTPATVARLKAEGQEMLQHILERGFALGTSVEVTGRDPFNGPLTVQVNGDERVLGYNVASVIWVEGQL